ncbi:MAG: hypothetical protein MJ213_02130 [Bacilli bacterium]|nr:hypothetical protein [Bacilli bacterium]
MKKLGLLVMPLMAVSLLASCGPKKYHINFDGGEYLTIDISECEHQKELHAKISVKDEYHNKYEVPQDECYYDITRGDIKINNYDISNTDDYNAAYLIIPKEEMTGDISIKVEGFCHYLTFSGEEGATIHYESVGEFTANPHIQYCDDLNNLNWKDWQSGEANAIVLDKPIYVKNTLNTLSESWKRSVYFVTGDENAPKVSASGNIMSLLNFNNLSAYCFYGLFEGCKSLISAPTLPAFILAPYCYQNMFYECFSLLKCPVLPAISLESECYLNMFYYCSALLAAPDLPATTLANDCYRAMFAMCTSLKEIPMELPATTLADGCYGFMFNGCSSIKTGPSLPATTLAENCYLAMFAHSSLVEPPFLPATTLADFCYANMFLGCQDLKINQTGEGTKFFEFPVDASKSCCGDMFSDTGGTFTEDPQPGKSYYYTLD